MEENYKTLVEIRKMIEAGNKFDAIVQRIAKDNYSVKFKIKDGVAEFALVTEKRKGREWGVRTFKSSDAALDMVAALGLKLAVVLMGDLKISTFFSIRTD